MFRPANIVHLRDVQTRPRIFTIWEKQRHTKSIHWLVECFAEFMGVFLYVYAGIGSNAAFILGNILEKDGWSSIFQVGFAFALGIVFAIVICGSTSGGHFNIAVTINMVVYKGFPPMKAVRYITAQVLGGYVACLLIYCQYYDLIKAAEATISATNNLGDVQFTTSGTAAIFALYAPAGSHLGRVFLNEFVTDVFLMVVTWGCIDPTNILVSPTTSPFIIAFAYAAAIWGFVVPGSLAANGARDIGARLAALTLYGIKAGGGRFAAISALTTIPAALFGAFLYEVFLTDSDRVMPQAQIEFLHTHKYHARSPHAFEGNEIQGNPAGSEDMVIILSQEKNNV